MSEIFEFRGNDKQGREVIVEGDDHSIWAYVFKHFNEGAVLEFDGFVCSLGTIVESSEEVKDFIDRNMSAPLMKKYANEFSIQKGIVNKNIEIEWNEDEVVVKVRNAVFLILVIPSQQ